MLVEVGYVARAHGIRGQLRVVCHLPESTALVGAAELIIGGQAHPVAEARPVAGGFLVTLADVGDRDAAEALRGQPVALAREALEVPAGQVLLDELIGCRAVRADGSLMGEVVGFELGGQDRLVIQQGGTEWLLPLVPAFVRAIDVAGRVITVDPPEGLPAGPARPVGGRR